MSVLDSVRMDYALVRRWWCEAEGWGGDELAAADAAFKAALVSRDGRRIAVLASGLAGMAEEIRRFEALVRAMEARMRTASAAERAAA